jgi:phosphoribosyl 1,2-cyclic phosphate phosphodiesterase
MEFMIMGSGGCVSLPKPLCKCEVCVEARDKGKPYSRFGCCLYLKDLNLILDTPEDIAQSINYYDLDKIDTVLYSHMDPDHTLGMRIFEQLRLNWLEVDNGNKCKEPINVYARKDVMRDLNNIKTKYGSFFDYYEDIMNLIKRKEVEDTIIIDNIKIHFVNVNHATIFIFDNNSKKLIYAPCDVKPLPHSELYYNADVMIIGNTIPCNVLKNGYILNDNGAMKKDLFSIDEIYSIKNKYNIKRTIITHLEEDWGKSYNDYLKLQDIYSDIEFAYDGMCISL